MGEIYGGCTKVKLFWIFKGNVTLKTGPGVNHLGCYIQAANNVAVKIKYLYMSPVANFSAAHLFNIKLNSTPTVYFARNISLQNTTDNYFFGDREDLSSFSTAKEIVITKDDSIYISSDNNTLNEAIYLRILAEISKYSRPVVAAENNNEITSSINQIYAGV